MAVTINASTSAGLINTADTSGILQLQTANVTALTIDASQNVGLGVTPSAWGTSGTILKALQIGAAGSIAAGTVDPSTHVSQNSFFNGSSWRYIQTNFATNYYQTEGTHVWRIAPSGTAGNAITFTQAMTLNSGGYLGIGTTSPSARVHAVGSGVDQAEIQAENTSTTSGARALVRVKSASSTYGGGLMISNATDATYPTSSLLLYNFDSQPLVFGTDNTERARIDSSGNLLVGTTTLGSGERLSVSSAAGNNEGVRITHNGAYSGINITATDASFADNVVNAITTRAASSAFRFFIAYANNVEQFRVTGNGVIYAQNTTVQSISDERLKENIRNSSEGLDVITALRPVRFDFKAGFGNDRKNQLGFIAQEIETVFPDAVDVWGESDDPENPYKSVGPAALIPVLVKAIQEQQAIIESLKARLDAANL
jgi:hypothetical protein